MYREIKKFSYRTLREEHNPENTPADYLDLKKLYYDSRKKIKSEDKEGNRVDTRRSTRHAIGSSIDATGSRIPE